MWGIDYRTQQGIRGIIFQDSSRHKELFKNLVSIVNYALGPKKMGSICKFGLFVKLLILAWTYKVFWHKKQFNLPIFYDQTPFGLLYLFNSIFTHQNMNKQQEPRLTFCFFLLFKSLYTSCIHVSKFNKLQLLKNICMYITKPFQVTNALLHFIYPTLNLWFTSSLISQSLWQIDSRFQKLSLWYLLTIESYNPFILLLNLHPMCFVLILVN